MTATDHPRVPVPPPAGTPPAAAVIWDRTPTTALDSEALLARIAECEAHARAQGWEVIGTWVDCGEVAVTADVRPQLDAALGEAERLGREREVVLLIHSNDRLSNDALWAASLRRRVRAAGVRLVLLVADTGTHVCLPPGPPPPVAGAAVSGSAR